jgi:hypothetical protein
VLHSGVVHAAIGLWYPIVDRVPVWVGEVMDSAPSSITFADQAEWGAEEGEGAVMLRYSAEGEVLVKLDRDYDRVLVGGNEIGGKDDLWGPGVANSYSVCKHVEDRGLEVWIAFEGRGPGSWG